MNETVADYLNNLANISPTKHITAEELETEIKSLIPQKAPDPDRITNRHFQNRPKNYSKYLHALETCQHHNLSPGPKTNPPRKS